MIVRPLTFPHKERVWTVQALMRQMPSYNYIVDRGLRHAKLFGERLRARREELGWSQGQLFEKTGVTASYISHVERGLGNPSLDIMVQLCEALGVQIGEMLADPPTNP